MNARAGNLAGKPPLGQKQPVLVSQRIRDFAAGQDCTLRWECCRRDPAYTIHAHIRMAGISGVAQKPDDWFGVHACDACHDVLDRRNSTKAEMLDWCDVLRAIHETQRRLFAAGILTAKGAK